MGRKRDFCFTNFDMEFDYDMYFKSVRPEYLMVGKETCPTTGKMHGQGYVYFRNARACKMKTLADELGGKCHVEPCKGNVKHNTDYCSKEGDFREWGQRPKQGKRVDLEAAADAVRNGKSVDDVAMEEPMVFHQYGRTLSRIEDIALRKRFRSQMTKGLWLWGGTNVGKSHAAHEGFDPLTHYVKTLEDQWWDGYTGQEIVILNEFRGQLKFSELLDLVDKWPKTVKRRGREPVPFLAQKLIVTSCGPPEEIYSGLVERTASDAMSQLYRRFNVQKLVDTEVVGGNTGPRPTLEELWALPSEIYSEPDAMIPVADLRRESAWWSGDVNLVCDSNGTDRP